MICKLFKTKISEWLLFAVLILIGLVIGIVAQAAEGGDNSYYQFSTIFVLGLPIGMNVFFAPASINNDFNLALGMGRTRKSFFVSEVLMEIFKYSIIFFAGFISYIIQKNIFSDLQEKTGLTHFFRWDIIIIAVLGGTAVSILFSMLTVKYEKKIIWVIYMLLCLLPGRIEEAMQKNDNLLLAKFGHWIIKILDNIDKTKCMMAGGVVIVIFLAVSPFITLNQDIKS